MTMLLLLAACSGDPAGDSGAADDTADVPITGYAVDFSTDPTPPVAGEEAAFSLTVTDQIGRPIEDLQQTHERMVHSHRHYHDAHHQHAHDPGVDPTEPHTHPHEHLPLTHTHPHYPDVHHRHAHHDSAAGAAERGRPNGSS